MRLLHFNRSDLRGIKYITKHIHAFEHSWDGCLKLGVGMAKCRTNRAINLLAALAVFAIPLGSHAAEIEKSGMANANRLHVAPENGATALSNKSTCQPNSKLTVDTGHAIAELYNHPTSRKLAAMLPLTLKFSDYKNVEKVAYFPRKLSTAKAPFG